jgi:uncharacterized membrane protein (UPF0127 family)
MPRRAPGAKARALNERERVVPLMQECDGVRASARTLCLLAALVLAALLESGAAAAQDVEPLTIDSADGRFEFEVEVAATPAERSRGLMYRRQLADDRGMLFDFGSTGPASMWMRNTYIPLDMLFIEPNGRIRKIAAETEPLSEDVVSSGGPVRAVLELRGGITGELGIEPGDQIIHPLFAEDGG